VHAACARGEASAARDLIDMVLHGAVADLSVAELVRARAQAVAGLLMALEGPQGQADHVARCLAVHGRYLSPAEIITRLDAVTLDEARAAGAAMLAHAPARAEIGAGTGRRRSK